MNVIKEELRNKTGEELLHILFESRHLLLMYDKSDWDIWATLDRNVSSNLANHNVLKLVEKAMRLICEVDSDAA